MRILDGTSTALVLEVKENIITPAPMATLRYEVNGNTIINLILPYTALFSIYSFLSMMHDSRMNHFYYRNSIDVELYNAIIFIEFPDDEYGPLPIFAIELENGDYTQISLTDDDIESIVLEIERIAINRREV